MFLVAKPALKALSNEDICDESLEARLNAAFQEHRAKYRTVVSSSSSTLPSTKNKSKTKTVMMSANHVHLAIKGILKIQLALQRNWRQEIIRKCFKNVGIWPLDVKLMISRCKTKITDEQLEFIMERMPELTRIFTERGEVTDEDFWRLRFDFVQEEEGDKDDLVLCRRRAVIFNNEGYLLREAEKQRAKADAILAAESLKRKKQEEKANAAVEAERKKQKKTEDNQYKARQAEQAAKGILVLKIKKT